MSGCRTPLRHLTRTVLPAPLSPTRAVTSPGYAAKLAPRSAWTRPKLLTRPLASSVGSLTSLLPFPPPRTAAEATPDANLRTRSYRCLQRSGPHPDCRACLLPPSLDVHADH